MPSLKRMTLGTNDHDKPILTLQKHYSKVYSKGYGEIWFGQSHY